MKVCILTHTFPRYEGDKISSIFMAELAKSLVEAGNDVWVLMPFTPLFKPSRHKYKVVTYKYIFPNFMHKLGYSETLSNDMGLPILMWFLSPFMYFFGFIALLRLVRNKKIDIINAHWILPNGFIASLVSVISGVPVISTLPGSDVYMAKKNRLFTSLARFAAEKSRWVTSNSPQLITDLSQITGINLENKSSVIIYGVGSDKFKPDKKAGEMARAELEISNKTKIILGVGRLVEKKGFEYLIRASKEIIKLNPDVRFVMIGDGDQRGYLEDLVKDLKVNSYFEFLGNVSYTKMNDYYNMCDVFVLPSIRDREGNLDDQSVAVMDALTCGKPVVTTDFPGYRVVIKNGSNGLLVEEKKSEELVRSINSLLGSRSVRQIMGRKARLLMIDKFSWKAIGREYTSLYKSTTEKYLHVE